MKHINNESIIVVFSALKVKKANLLKQTNFR